MKCMKCVKCALFEIPLRRKTEEGGKGKGEGGGGGGEAGKTPDDPASCRPNISMS